jgi:hypothetical protein
LANLSIAGAFAGTFATGLYLTSVFRQKEIDRLPAREIFEALYRDGIALQISFLGWAVSAIVSVLSAWLARRLVLRFRMKALP